MSIIKEYNPFKKILAYVVIGLVFIILALLVIFVSWVMNHIYTTIWFLCVVACVIWFVYSLLPTANFPQKEDLDEKFD
jgi:c-di-AMP phosphodiesterase-like protein